MSILACADLVRRGDPDRFAATMAAPAALRPRLWPLYAYNLEIARAPWTSAEPMIAEMRLQFWIDTVEEIAAGAAPRAHEVAAPLADLVRSAPLPPALLVDMAEARRWDIGRDPFADRVSFDDHIDRTAGHLMWCAALALGAPPQAEAVLRDFAWGAGLAAWLGAIPALEMQGRRPLVDGRPEAVAALAAEGLARIAGAHRGRGLLPRKIAPALWPGWQATAILRRAAADPARVTDGTLAPSEFRRRLGLMRRAATGSW